MRSLCICCDDVGLHASIDAAAWQLIGLGRLHAVSGMVGGPTWPAIGRSLREVGGETLDVGLHLDLTERPLDPRHRSELGRLIVASHLGALDRVALRAEIRAQFDAFEAHLDRPPAHVDGHRHVHQLPIVRDLLLDELQRRYGDAARPWLRSTRAPRGPAAGDLGWGEAFKARLIEGLGDRGLQRRARPRHASNARLLGVYDFSGGPVRYHELLADWLDGVDAADLLMCHPAQGDNPADAIQPARQAEFEVLSSAQAGQLLRAARLRLAPMSRLLASAGLAG